MSPSLDRFGLDGLAGERAAEAGPLIGATFAALVQKPFLPAKEEASTILGGAVGNCAFQK